MADTNVINDWKTPKSGEAPGIITDTSIRIGGRAFDQAVTTAVTNAYFSSGSRAVEAAGAAAFRG